MGITTPPVNKFLIELRKSLSPAELIEYDKLNDKLGKLLDEYNTLADAEHQERAKINNPLLNASSTVTVNINGRNTESLTKLFKKINEVSRCRSELFAFKWRNNPERIYPEATEIIDTVKPASFERMQQERYTEELRQVLNIEPNYSFFLDYICWHITPHLQALRYYDMAEELQKLMEYAKEYAAKFYTPQELTEQTEPDAFKETISSITAPNIQTSRPEFYISLNDAVSNAAFNPVRQEKIFNKPGELQTTESGQYYFADIGVNTGRKKVNTFLSIYYDNNITFTKGNKAIFLNDEDKGVLDGIITLIKASPSKNGTAFTLPMLYGAMTGRAASDARITPAIEKRLISKLKKLENTKVELNLENEKLHYTNSEGETVELSGFKENIITLGEANVRINHTPVKAYVIRTKPMLLIYAESNDKLISTPIKALELGNGIKNTPEVIALRQFLINEIARIKSPKPQSNHITYEAIYSRLEYLADASEPQTPKAREKARAQTRKNVYEILSSFKDAGIITTFKEVKQGKSYHHIEIIPAPKN